MTNEVNTPDYSGPQVVPGQFTHYPHGGRPFSPSSNGGTSVASPQVRPYTFKEHVDQDGPISRPGTVPPPVPPKDEPRRCGMKRRTFLILIGCVLIWVLALALGLGLGLGLGLKKKNNSYVRFVLYRSIGCSHNTEAHQPVIRSVEAIHNIALVDHWTQTTTRRRVLSTAPGLPWLENRGTWARDESSPFISSTIPVISGGCSTPMIKSGRAEANSNWLRLMRRRGRHSQPSL